MAAIFPDLIDGSKEKKINFSLPREKPVIKEIVKLKSPNKSSQSRQRRSINMPCERVVESEAIDSSKRIDGCTGIVNYTLSSDSDDSSKVRL